MKLNKEIVDALKRHGFITVPCPTDYLVEHFKTVRDLAVANFITNPAAFSFVESIFTEEGENVPSQVSEKELEKQAVEEPVDESETETEVVDEVVEEKPVDEVVEEKPVDEVVEEKPVDEVVEEKPKPKKNTRKTTKKTTEKES